MQEKNIKFDEWNSKKKSLSINESKKVFNSKEIWWCSVGYNLGNESNGKGENYRRPVLIIKKLSATSFIGLPLSTKIKTGSWYQTIIINKVESSVQLNQIKMISFSRLQRKLANLDADQFRVVKEKLKILLELS